MATTEPTRAKRKLVLSRETVKRLDPGLDASAEWAPSATATKCENSCAKLAPDMLPELPLARPR